MLLYLHGFASGPQSFKAQRFLHHLQRRGLALEVPALDEGDFEHLTLSRQLALVERLTRAAPRPHVLIGSSMGGYLALLHADYHEPSDDVAHADLAHMTRVIDSGVRALRLLTQGAAPQWKPGMQPREE